MVFYSEYDKLDT